ncbi:hypothetical protein [Treponema sp. C6A8]|uniref:hypothetical protein n=1 Tax=Treponema sp. C6A8 TaxID=1410609 RepID=UPI001C07026D|nr:hypothetical protein [Treponema sp. C6A8]
MKYKRSLFGKVVPKNEDRNRIKRSLEHNPDPYTERNIIQLHGLVGVLFVWCIYILLDMLFGIEIQVPKGNAFLAFLWVMGIPVLFGVIKVKIIDKFLDTFDYRIKWFFMIFVFVLFAALIVILVKSK